MGDGDTVKMKLTFPRGKQQPGDVIDVPADEVHRWKGFAVKVDDAKPNGKTPTTPAAAAAEPAKATK